MSKELEAFNEIKDFGLVGHTLEEYKELVYIIENGLIRLEAIDNVEPSYALECWEKMQDRIASNISTIEYNTIKQALKPKSKKELAWDIVREKRINLEYFINDFIEDGCNYTFYKAYFRRYGAHQLTEKEFNLLKEVLG